MTDYKKLHSIARKRRVLEGISSLLTWDQETHMPPDGAPIRSEQLEMLAKLIHKERTSTRFKNSLAKLIDIESGKLLDSNLNDEQRRAVALFRRDYLKERALPSSFVEKFARLTSSSIEVWRKAKEANNFKLFAPQLEKIITMVRKKTDYLGYEDHPYDALLDNFEPDLKTQELTQVFGQLKGEVTALLGQIKNSVDDHFLKGEFPRDKQVAFCQLFLEEMGYTKAKGCLDFSTHPFSSASHPSDSRITTYIKPCSLMSNILAVLHEAGHALYEMGLNEEHYGSPLGEDLSMGIHESQSQWWETFIGLSRPFWHQLYPKFQKAFGVDAPFETFYRAINKVQPSMIRVTSDEVTYPLHIILRFEMEKALVDGSLKVKEIPEAWNDKMETLLGIRPKNDAEGCLQDIHWAWGEFGYFPSYALGNLYAAHLFQGFEKQHPQWGERVKKGELLFIGEWLKENVHRHGRRYSRDELLERATGKPFSPHAFINHLKEKYIPLQS